MKTIPSLASRAHFIKRNWLFVHGDTNKLKCNKKYENTSTVKCPLYKQDGLFQPHLSSFVKNKGWPQQSTWRNTYIASIKNKNNHTGEDWPIYKLQTIHELRYFIKSRSEFAEPGFPIGSKWGWSTNKRFLLSVAWNFRWYLYM